MPVGSANASTALNALTTPVDYSSVDGLAGQLGQTDALNGLKGQVGGLQSQFGGQLAQANQAKGIFDQVSQDTASTSDKAKYSGSGLLKKFVFLAVKGFQAYIVFSITTGGVFSTGVDGSLLPYIIALVYASFLAQLVDLLLLVAPALGADLLHKMHADFLLHSIGTVNVLCSTTLIGFLTLPWGATGYPVEFLQTIVQVHKLHCLTK